MDHNEAVRLQAAEKYVLGEFPQNLREEYEEHFFDCAECARDLKAAAVFVDTTREVLRAAPELSAERNAVPARAHRQAPPFFFGWRRWLQPVLVPAFAALLLVVGYQNLFSIPHWRAAAEHSAQASAQATAPHVLPSFSLLAVNTRGGGRPVLNTTLGKSFLLKFDIPDTDASASTGYLIQLQDASGASHPLGTISREEARNTVFVEVPAGFLAGNAKLVVLEVPQAGAAAREITSLPFVVAFGPDIEQHP
jgi:anti-sigma factor RsiW